MKQRRHIFIRDWRHKVIFLLVVYFAGFATAVYCLAPAPQGTSNQNVEKGFAHLSFRSEEFAMTLNEGLHKLIDFSKTAALHTADFIKQKYNQRKAQSKS